MHCLQIPQTDVEWKAVAEAFWQQWNFPNCIGAIDGKHVHILLPPNSGSVYYNYKSFNSIVLLALVDAHYKFLYVDIGSFWRISDGGVYNSSSISTALETGQLNACQLPNSEIISPFVIVADDAFALKTNIMKPYGSRNLTVNQRIFSRARRVVENAFGIMCSRFRVFGKAIPLAPEKVQTIVMAACCLHNYLLRNPVSASQYMPEDTNPTTDLQTIRHQGSNRSSKAAMAIWDDLCNFVVSESGLVSWQLKAVGLCWTHYCCIYHIMCKRLWLLYSTNIEQIQHVTEYFFYSSHCFAVQLCRCCTFDSYLYFFKTLLLIKN